MRETGYLAYARRVDKWLRLAGQTSARQWRGLTRCPDCTLPASAMRAQYRARRRGRW